MNRCLRYLLIAVVAWLPVGQVLAACCLPQAALQDSAMTQSTSGSHCDGHHATAEPPSETSQSVDICQCGCSLIGHTPLVVDGHGLQAFHAQVVQRAGRLAQPLPAHDFPLLRPPTALF